MLKQTLVIDSVKKHSVRYNAEPEDPNPIMSSAYIMKAALVSMGTTFPETINITLQAGE